MSRPRRDNLRVARASAAVVAAPLRYVAGAWRLTAVGHMLRAVAITVLVLGLAIVVLRNYGALTGTGYTVMAVALLHNPWARSTFALAGEHHVAFYGGAPVELGGGDATTAVTDASAAAWTAGGGNVRFGAGTYTFQEAGFHQGVFFRGAGAGVTRVEPSDAAAVPTRADGRIPFLNAVATAEVVASDRWSYGGVSGMHFDGLDQNDKFVGISTWDLQTVDSIDGGATGVYVWLQQVPIDQNVFDNLVIGVELYGDSRHVPVWGNRFVNCDTCLYASANHPNLRWNSMRDSRVNFDFVELLDAEIIGLTCSQSDYGIGGPYYTTALTAAIGAGDAMAGAGVISVIDTTLITSGWIEIDSEKFTYTGKTADTLTGVTRAAGGTAAAAHAALAPLRRLDRFAQRQGRTDRCRFIGGIFFQNKVMGARVTNQDTFLGNFVWMLGAGSSRTGTTANGSNVITAFSNTTGFKVGMKVWGAGVPDNSTIWKVDATAITISANATASASVSIQAAGVALEDRGADNNVTSNWLIEFDGSTLIAKHTGTSGTVEQVGHTVHNNHLGVAGGGRAWHKVSGTDDIQMPDWANNEVLIAEEPLDGLGGAGILYPAGVGNCDYPDIAHNKFRSIVVQTKPIVDMACTSPGGYRHESNRYWTVAGVKTSKTANFSATPEGSVNTLNILSNSAPMTLGTVSAKAHVRYNPGHDTGENVVTIRGTIDGSNGNTLQGTGWSAVRNSAGKYTVTFASAFLSVPTLDVSASGAANRIATIDSGTAPTTTVFVVQVRDAAGTAINPVEVHFIAAGPRSAV